MEAPEQDLDQDLDQNDAYERETCEALHAAILHNRWEVVQMMLVDGIDIDAVDYDVKN